MSSKNEPIKILAPQSFRESCRGARSSKWAVPRPGSPSSPACGDDEKASDATSGGRPSARGTSAAALWPPARGDVGDSGTGLGVAPATTAM